MACLSVVKISIGIGYYHVFEDLHLTSVFKVFEYSTSKFVFLCGFFVLAVVVRE